LLNEQQGKTGRPMTSVLFLNPFVGKKVLVMFNNDGKTASDFKDRKNLTVVIAGNRNQFLPCA
jgi:hypothetical protein